ncbi:hypothetical protein [Pimelobacter simplex]|uniref:hypothetical protein n=1 Tax=Nocardioides simplex TaxID=2045 RepID=UPI00214F7DEE|nr:hypothetical protein [Pimelobacter simplex]UUW92687.1 hypothetical protein M0M43_14750 [Pimelobacter simplex]UUW96515.1 hypothetical protein M0M48_03385 [Pimelobacter simplex]
MNWFTWLVIVLGGGSVAYTLFLLVRPRRSKVDETARLREKYQGEDFYRGGTPGVGGFNGAGDPFNRR